MEKAVVVDPYPNSRIATEMFLRGYGNGKRYDVSGYSNSREALDSCKAEIPHLIICADNALGWPEFAGETAHLYPRRKFLLLLDPLPQEEKEVMGKAEEFKEKGLIDDYRLKPIINWNKDGEKSFPQILESLFRKPYPARRDIGRAEASP